MIEVSFDTFKREVLDSDIPALVEFWASWCPPCKMMEPVILALEKEYLGKIKFISINIDRNAKIANDLNINGVPTFIYVNEGKIKETRLVGAQTRRKILSLLRGEI